MLNKNCPFCGHKATYRKDKIQYDQLHGKPLQRSILGCFSPKCNVNPQVIDITPDFCSNRWNKRQIIILNN